MCKVFAFFMFLVGFNALANSNTCHSSNDSLSYTFQSPNGGAARGNLEYLKVNEQVLIDKDPWGRSTIETADIQFSDKPLWSSAPVVKGTFEVTDALYSVKVVLFKKGTVVFDNFAFCTYSRYIGQPIP